MKLKLVSTDDNVYEFSDGSKLRIEKSHVSGSNWVYRNANGEVLGFNKLSTELADKFDLDLYN